MKYVGIIFIAFLINGLATVSGKNNNNEWIYYSSNRSGSYQIYRIRPDRTENQQLTFGIEDNYFQSVSANGEWLIFQSVEGEDYFLYRLNLATMQTEQLTYVKSRFESWSPNEQSFIYDVFAESGSQLWWMDWQDFSTKLVTDADYGYPQWSPDGQWIAFTLHEDQNLYRVTPGGNDLIAITDFKDFKQVVIRDWLPDGNWLIFGAHSSNGDYHLYRIQPDGSGLLQLTYQSGVQNYVNWLSNENWIIFYQHDTNLNNIFRMRRDGSGIQQITTGDQDWFVGASAKRMWLYWSEEIRSPSSWGHLFELNPDTLETRQLTKTGFEIGFPSLSPDKRWLIFSLKDDEWGLYILPSDRFEPYQLLAGDKVNHFEYWQQ